MKIKMFILLLMFCIASFAGINTVTVNGSMLHAPNAYQNRYTGKVTYTLDSEGYDSVTVSLKIVLASDATVSLALDTVYGAVGIIHLLPSTTERTIWFSAPNAGQESYKAIVSAIPLKSFALSIADSMVNAASQSDMVSMFSGFGTINGGDAFFSTAGLGKLQTIYQEDGPHGVSKDLGKATAFTTCGGLACTWSPELAHLQGVAMGQEFRAYDQNIQLGPAMNIVYHPQLGRAFEYFSEDSYLSGKMAAAEVRGIQSVGVIPTIKHFICNNMENDRANLSAEIDERTLRELYAPQFRECVTEAGALGLMTAYNAVNGVFCMGNKYLVQDLLRTEWGFNGLSMSDYAALMTNVDDAVKYGVDEELPIRSNYTLSTFQNFDISYTKMHARNIVYALAKTGALNEGYQRRIYTESLNSAEHQALVRAIGSKALVLAKNDNATLPIPKTGAKIFLTGPEIDVCRTGGGDTFDWESSLVDAFRKITPKQGITEYIDALTDAGKSTIVTNINLANYIVVAIGVHGEGEGKDRVDQTVRDEAAVTAALATAAATQAKVVVLYTGGSAALPGDWVKAPAILICFGPGQEQGYSIADVLFGDVNPSGKLNCTFVNSTDQLPNFTLTADKKMIYPSPDSAHGYFRVDKMGASPLFAFGHGLSYTTFSYSDLRVFPENIVKGDKVNVSVNVSNTGTVPGEEIVQLYLSLPDNQGVKVRVQDLRGFRRVALNPGESKTVVMELTDKEMAYFKTGPTEWTGTGGWEVLSGTYGVRVGTSSRIVPQPDQPSVASSFVVQ
jgi:beta-glucosidase